MYLKKNNKKNILSFNLIYKILTFYNKSHKNSILTNTFYILLNLRKFKHVYKSVFNVNITYNSKFSITKCKTDNNFLTKKINLLILNSKFFLNYNKVQVHYSFHKFYIFNKHSNIVSWNLNKLANTWKNIFFIVKSIFFYNIKYICFSSFFLKKEAIFLNNTAFKTLKSTWRYSSYFIHFFNTKKTISTEFYFKSLLVKQYNMSFLIDFHYHKTALFFLKKFNFLTIGPVPISSSLYSLDIVFPLPSNLNNSNYFFVKSIINIKKDITN